MLLSSSSSPSIFKLCLSSWHVNKKITGSASGGLHITSCTGFAEVSRPAPHFYWAWDMILPDRSVGRRSHKDILRWVNKSIGYPNCHMNHNGLRYSLSQHLWRNFECNYDRLFLVELADFLLIIGMRTFALQVAEINHDPHQKFYWMSSERWCSVSCYSNSWWSLSTRHDWKPHWCSRSSHPSHGSDHWSRWRETPVCYSTRTTGKPPSEHAFINNYKDRQETLRPSSRLVCYLWQPPAVESSLHLRQAEWWKDFDPRRKWRYHYQTNWPRTSETGLWSPRLREDEFLNHH